MIMTAINILALIVALALLGKFFLVLMNPKRATRICTDILTSHKGFMVGLSAILIALTGYYVLSVVAIEEITASLAFVGSLILFSVLLHPETISRASKAMIKDRLSCAISMLPWAALAAYTIYVILA